MLMFRPKKDHPAKMKGFNTILLISLSQLNNAKLQINAKVQFRNQIVYQVVQVEIIRPNNLKLVVI